MWCNNDMIGMRAIEYNSTLARGRTPVDFTISVGVSGLELCTIEEKKSSVLELSMESEIPPHDLVSLASYFDNVDLLVGLLPLSAAVVSDVVNKKHSHTTQSAVHYGLLSWGRIKPEEVTFQALIDIAHKLTREDIVRNIKEYFYKNYRNM